MLIYNIFQVFRQSIMKYSKFVLYLVVALHVSAVRADAFVDFFRAVTVDNVSGVSSLLQRGFDPNAVDEKGQLAIIRALRDESYQVAAVLLAHPGLRVDETNSVGETALMMAALRGSVDWCGRLIGRGAAVNRKGWAPLHYAASGPEPATVSLLLDRGAEVDAPSPNGTTALMMAARYGDERSVDALLARQADRQRRNDKGMTAADFARSAGREKLAARLEPGR